MTATLPGFGKNPAMHRGFIILSIGQERLEGGPALQNHGAGRSQAVPGHVKRWQGPLDLPTFQEGPDRLKLEAQLASQIVHGNHHSGFELIRDSRCSLCVKGIDSSNRKKQQVHRPDLRQLIGGEKVAKVAQVTEANALQLEAKGGIGPAHGSMMLVMPGGHATKAHARCQMFSYCPHHNRRTLDRPDVAVVVVVMADQDHVGLKWRQPVADALIRRIRDKGLIPPSYEKAGMAQPDYLHDTQFNGRS